MDPHETAQGSVGPSGFASTDPLLAELVEVNKAVLAELRLIRAELASLRKHVAERPGCASPAPSTATPRDQPPIAPESKDSRSDLVQAIIARNKARAKSGGAGGRQVP
ncbi:hypothetical protein PCS_03184 [Desulfocurvibacter africanus PCS]|uniref:Uncharacterized protein n=1 Tax=Desulfocurvibacter africanus PCS TaxID=1262666 RepID=M5PPW4_DESAF|nr:hypothetical protein [Desulfocurvibacter africanus]EMG35985.1 hypothetical protein PCS_03184 [Desulfocurvibacter africanus PCS]